MLNFFIPQETKFFEMLEVQSGNTCLGADEFKAFISEFSSLDEDAKKERAKSIKEIERKGDRLSKEITDLLHKSFITPLDREDIHALTYLLDDLLDLIDIFSRKLIQFNIGVIPKLMMQQAALVHEVVYEVDKAVKALRHSNRVSVFCDRIRDIEEKGDFIHNKAIGGLFRDSLEPMEIIKLKDLYEDLELLTDRGKDTAKVIEGIVVKHA